MNKKLLPTALSGTLLSGATQAGIYSYASKNTWSTTAIAMK